MRIFNITLLLNSFKNNKNAKQFLLFINIGIFLSIFAISSAIITFYTETKIDSIEFDLITEHNDKKYYDDTLDNFSKIRNTIYSLQKSEDDLINLYQHSASTKLGSKLLSINDIYLPILFFDLSSEDSKYFQMFFGDDVDGIDYMKVIMDQVNSFYNSDDWLPKSLDKKLKSIKEYKDILNKDYNKYYDKVFSYNYSSILNEVYYENDQLVDTDNQIYIDYNKMRKFYEEIDNLFYLIEIFLTDYAVHSQSLIDAGNSEIIKLSKRENNIIIIAFFLQLIIFCIIQYFEINSIQQARKKNA